MRSFVFSFDGAGFFLAGRSLRSLLASGLKPGVALLGQDSLARELAQTETPLLLLQSGAWLDHPLPASIPSSATGLPLLAYGRTRDDPDWTRFLEEGDDFAPTPRCLYLETTVAHRLGHLLQSQPWAQALRSLLHDSGIRSVQLPELTQRFDPHLRVLEVVTTIQIGGAERVALDLAEELNQRGTQVWVAALSRAPRKAYPTPQRFFDLSEVPRSPQARAQALLKIARALAADIIHGHLLSGAECEALQGGEIPLVITLHNLPQSWPRGFNSSSKKADLLIACAQVVAQAIDDAKLGSPCRTAWNGIAPFRYWPIASAMALAQQWRQDQSWSPSDFVLISVANPRAQKQLHRIPEIIQKLQSICPGRKVRWILAGESVGSDGVAAQSALQAAIDHWEVGENVLLAGSSNQVSTLLCASDVFLSTSHFEGLSLAHLEALASGLPVVTTDVGGAAEVANELGEHAGFYQRVPVDASAEAFAKALVSIPDGERVCRLPEAFTRARMARRLEQLYRVAIGIRQRANRAPDGLFLICNNFSMGGAQSSARRLLERLKSEAIAVRAFTIQEERPTRGTQTLTENGISVSQISPRHLKNPATGAAEILAAIVEAPPKAIVFWNLITSYKVLIADGAQGIPIFDVSPGEMYFSALEQYFRSPRQELPYRCGREYGALLAAIVVKFAREKARAQERLGCSTSVIRNGVELQWRPKRNSNGKLIFGAAARISPEKRLEDLIAAFALAHPKLPSYELHIAGKIERGADAYAQQLRLQGALLPIVWRGELPGSAQFLEELDLFVQISEPAGCPNASLEAMAAGLPIIATDFGGAHEQVIDRKTGRLTPARDNVALSDAIVELAHDEQARSAYGRAAQTHIACEFSLDAMVANYRSLCLPDHAPNQVDRSPCP